jgi:hypothetical protein
MIIVLEIITIFDNIAMNAILYIRTVSILYASEEHNFKLCATTLDLLAVRLDEWISEFQDVNNSNFKAEVNTIPDSKLLQMPAHHGCLNSCFA